MSFCYALVSRDNVPLCQHCAVSGNFDLFYQKFIPKDSSSEAIKMVAVDGYIWGTKKAEEGLNMLIVVRDNCNKDIIVKTLEEIYNRFVKMYNKEWKRASTFSLQTSFEPTLIEIFKVVQQEIDNLVEITPPSYMDNESSEAGEYELLNPVKYSRQPPAIPRRKNNYLKYTAIAVSLIVLLSIIAYIIVALICGDFHISRCSL